mgnify:FL=1
MASGIPFVRDLNFEYGQVDEITPLIRRVIANNPSPFTFTGTGTYILGKGEVAVIDPGPQIEGHLQAILAAIKGETVTHILITHTHLDHSPLARPLQEATGAPIYAYGPHTPGTAWTDTAPPETLGGDLEFAPDHTISDKEVIVGSGWTLDAVHTPGHTDNHLCFALKEESVLFSGDMVMGWSTTIVSPPDGDMRDYIQSCRKLLGREDVTYWPTHGPCITDPAAYVTALIDHREKRELAISRALQNGTEKISAIVAEIYKDISPNLHAAAARTVHAHLIHMAQTGRVTFKGPPTDQAIFQIINK